MNPDCEGLLSLRMVASDLAAEAAIEGCGDNDVVTLHWQNATLSMRAGAVRAILELSRL